MLVYSVIHFFGFSGGPVDEIQLIHICDICVWLIYIDFPNIRISIYCYSVSVELMFDAHITKIPICLSFMSPIQGQS